MIWFFYAFSSAFLSALSGIFVRVGYSVDPTLAATIHSMVTTGFLIAASLFLNKMNGASISTLNSTHGWYILLAGIAGGIEWICYFIALKYGIFSKVIAIYQLNLVITLILSALLWGEGTGLQYIIGGILMSIGVYLISV